MPLSNRTLALGGMGATSATSRWKPSPALTARRQREAGTSLQDCACLFFGSKSGEHLEEGGEEYNLPAMLVYSSLTISPLLPLFQNRSILKMAKSFVPLHKSNPNIKKGSKGFVPAWKSNPNIQQSKKADTGKKS